MRYKLTIAYDGSAFHGWQRQKDSISVQQFLEETLSTILKTEIKIEGSGRTDTGVHAKAQIAHMDFDEGIDSYSLIRSLNYFGKNKGVSLLKVEKALDDFHARYSAIERTYHYFILNREGFCPFLKGQVWHLRDHLNLDAMQAGANLLIGRHDFTSFRDTNCQAKSPVKNLNEFKLTKTNDLIQATIKAPSFLHHQVRIMIGTLVNIGQEKSQPESINDILAQKNRIKAGITAPSSGLFLVNVSYKL